MRIETVSVFPQMFDEVVGTSIIGRAQAAGVLEFVAHDLRDWTHDKHRTTDDEPYGGGQGQLFKVEPVFEALDELLGVGGGSRGSRGTFPVLPSPNSRVILSGGAAVVEGSPHLQERRSFDCAPCGRSAQDDTEGTGKGSTGNVPLLPPEGTGKGSTGNIPLLPAGTTVIFFTPHGRRFDQQLAQELAGCERLIMVCGRYEGFDERVYQRADLCISLGDYILTGGELPAMVVTDAVCRLLPGVLGNELSNADESFSAGLLEYPQYTRPAEYRGLTVPEVLLGGNHAAVAAWRRQMSIIKTAQFRPDLLATAQLTAEERQLAEQYRQNVDR